MLEITSTPLVIMAILGTVGILIPIISIARKEQGSNSFYAVIAFAALIVSMGYVGYQFISPISTISELRIVILLQIRIDTIVRHQFALLGQLLHSIKLLSGIRRSYHNL